MYGDESRVSIFYMVSCISITLAYQVARAIADLHDVEDDGHASIAHSKFAPTSGFSDA